MQILYKEVRFIRTKNKFTYAKKCLLFELRTSLLIQRNAYLLFKKRNVNLINFKDISLITQINLFK